MTFLPGAVLDPGAHWNYQAGRTSADVLVWHYTVGRDSRALIRNQGLAPILIWDDVVWEYAPLDAVCYTQCEWNRVAIGYEVESLDGSITPGQIANLGYATLFALTTFGIPAEFYDGPRLPVGTPYRGVTNHRNLIHRACDMHSDGFDRWVWDIIWAAPKPRVRMAMSSHLIHDVRPGPNQGKVYDYDADAHTKTAFATTEAFLSNHWLRGGVAAFGGWADQVVHRTDDPNDGARWAQMLDDAIDLRATPPAGSTGGATPAQVTAIVAQSEQRVIGEVQRPKPLVGSVG